MRTTLFVLAMVLLSAVHVAWLLWRAGLWRRKTAPPPPREIRYVPSQRPADFAQYPADRAVLDDYDVEPR